LFKSFAKYFLLIVVLFACNRNVTQPKVTESIITDSSAFSISIRANIHGSKITDKGVCWSTEPNPTIDNFSVSAGSGAGTFDIKAIKVINNCKIYLRVYATNAKGIRYGDELACSTVPHKDVVTGYFYYNEKGEPSIDGFVTKLLGATQVGFCWSKTAIPSIENSVSVIDPVKEQLTATLSDLERNTDYFVRVYAVCPEGVYYGNIVKFKTYSEQVTDIEGNKYNTVVIGTQTWTVENLRTTKYQNGSEVFYRNNGTSWDTTNLAAYGYYANLNNFKNKYGYFYNHFAIDDNRNLAPNGWHIATFSDWQELVRYLVGEYSAVSQLISSVKSSWPLNQNPPNISSRFDALPGGYRKWPGGFDFEESATVWFWTTQEFIGEQAMAVSLSANISSHLITFKTQPMRTGAYIRCVKNK
jgi:uncharacterized protein (TIGR02145 family)